MAPQNAPLQTRSELQLRAPAVRWLRRKSLFGQHALRHELEDAVVAPLRGGLVGGGDPQQDVFSAGLGAKDERERQAGRGQGGGILPSIGEG